MNKRLAEDSDKTLYRSFKKKACKTHETKAENFYFFNVKIFSHIIINYALETHGIEKFYKLCFRKLYLYNKNVPLKCDNLK